MTDGIRGLRPAAWRHLSSAKNAKWTVQKNYPAQLEKWDGYKIEPLYSADALRTAIAERDEARARLADLVKPEESREWLPTKTIDRLQARAEAAEARLKEAKAVLGKARIYVEMIVTDQFADSGTDKADLAAIDAILGGSDAR